MIANDSRSFAEDHLPLTRGSERAGKYAAFLVALAPALNMCCRACAGSFTTHLGNVYAVAREFQSAKFDDCGAV